MAMDKYDIEKDIATDVKKHFDEECEGSWHCVVSSARSKTSGRCLNIWQRVENICNVVLPVDSTQQFAPYLKTRSCQKQPSF